jgi:hypothetical protein
VTNTPTTAAAWTWGQSVATTGTGPTATIEIDVRVPGRSEPEPVVVPLADARVLHAMLGDAIHEMSQGCEAIVGQTAAADRADPRDRIITALDNAHHTHPCPHTGRPYWLGCFHPDGGVGSCHSGRRADAVLSVLPAPVGRGAVLREAADELEAPYEPESGYDRGRAWVIEELRRMADEAGPDDVDEMAASLARDGFGADEIAAMQRAADEAQQLQPERTPCSEPNPCEDGELCDVHEVEQAHADGEHGYCGVTCEVQFPTEMLRNGIIAGGIPGTAGMLDELLRRAAAGRGEAL